MRVIGRVFKWLVIALASLLLLVAVALAVLHTDWGLEQVRKYAEKTVNGMINGQVKLGRIHGSLLTKFTIDGVEVRDSHGNECIRSRQVLVNYDFMGIIHQRFTADAIEFVEPIVIGKLEENGKLNLTQLMKPRPEDAGKPWVVRINGLRIRQGLFVIPSPETTYSFARVELDAKVYMRAMANQIEVVRASALWLERGIPVQMQGSVVTSDPLIAFSGMQVVVGESHVGVPLGMLRPHEMGWVGVLDVAVKEHDVFHFWPHAFALGDVKLNGALVRGTKEKPIDARLEIDALKGHATLAALGNPDVPAASGKLIARGIVSPLPTAPGKVDFDLSIDATGQSVKTLKGTLNLEGSGVVVARKIDKLKLAVVAGGGVARADLTAALPEARGTAHADVRLSRPIYFESLEAKLSASDLGAALSQPRLHGQAGLEVAAHGSLDDLSARGKLHLRRVRQGKMRIDRADAGFELAGLPRAPHGRVEARAAGDAGNLPFNVKTDLQVAHDEGGTLIRLGNLALQAHGLDVRGRGGEILLKKGGGLGAHDLVLRSPAGSVEIEGDLAPPQPGPRTRHFSLPTGKLHLHAHDLDLARLQGAFAPRAQPIAGKLSTDLHIVREGRVLGIEGDVIASGIVLRPRWPAVDATARIDLGKGRAVGMGHVRARSPRGDRTLGIVDFSFDSKTPADPLDAAGWRALGLENAIDGLRIAIRDVDLATVGTLARRKDLKGRIDATIEAKPDDRSIAIQASFTDVAFPRFTDVDITADGVWSRDRFVLDAKTSLNGVEALKAHAQIGAGLATMLKGIDPKTLPIAVSLDVEHLEVGKIAQSLPGAQKIGGVLSGKARLDGTIGVPRAQADLRLDEANIGGVAFTDARISGELDARRISGRVSVRQQKGGSIEASGVVDRLADNAVVARLQARRFDLAFLSALAAKKTDALAGAGGELEADITVNASRSSRSAEGQLAIHHGQVYTPTSGLVTQIELAAHASKGQLVIDKLQGRGIKGTVKGEGTAVLVGLLPKYFRGRVVADDFPVSTGSMVVGVNTDADIQGYGDEEGWNLTAIMKNTKVRLPKEGRTGEKLQSTGELEDVVYTDMPDFSRRTGISMITGQQVVKEGGKRDLRLVLKTPGGVRVSGMDADLLINSNLVVLQRGGQTYVGGGVTTNRGFVELFDRRYDVVRANASFNENDLPDPRLDIRLAHEFRTATLFIDVRGTARHPEVSLSAEPGAYDQAQLIGWVMGGDPDDETVAGQPLDAQAVGLASNLALSQVQGLVKQALPLDVLAVKVGEGSNPQTTRFEVGKWLTQNLFLGYIYRMNAPEEKNLNEAQAEYRLGRRWLLEAFFGDRGVAGADLMWSKKY